MSEHTSQPNDLGNVHALGTLDFFGRFCHQSNFPPNLPLHICALTCLVAAGCLRDFPPDFAPASIHIQLEQLGGHPVLVLQFALGELEIAWLADAEEGSDIWMAIDMWNEAGRVPIVIGVGEGSEERYHLFMPSMPAEVPRADEGRCLRDDIEYWESMLGFCRNHGAAFPLVTKRVPPLPRPANFKALRYVMSQRDKAD